MVLCFVPFQEFRHDEFSSQLGLLVPREFLARHLVGDYSNGRAGF
jgi:hypothetical protein